MQAQKAMTEAQSTMSNASSKTSMPHMPNMGMSQIPNMGLPMNNPITNDFFQEIKEKQHKDKKHDE